MHSNAKSPVSALPIEVNSCTKILLKLDMHVHILNIESMNPKKNLGESWGGDGLPVPPPNWAPLSSSSSNREGKIIRGINNSNREALAAIKGGKGRVAVYSIESGVDGKRKSMDHKASAIIYLKS